MPIKIACQCGRQLMVPDNRAGRTVQCPKCAQRVPVPGERQLDPEPPVLPTVVPAAAAAEKPVVTPQPVVVPPPTKPQSPAAEPIPAKKQKQEVAPLASAPASAKIPAPPPLTAPPPTVVTKPALPEPPPPPALVAEPAPPPRWVEPTPPAVILLKKKPAEEAPTAPPPRPKVVHTAPVSISPPVLPAEKPTAKASAATSLVASAPAPAPTPPPEPAPIPPAPEPQAQPAAKPTTPTALAPSPAVPAKKSASQPADGAAAGFPPALAKLVSARPGYRPDADKLSAAYVLAMLLVLLGIVSMVPGVLEVIRFLRDTDSWPVGRWAFVIFFLGLLHFAYAMYLGQLPDWSAAWVLTSATLLQGAVYGAVLTALYLVGGQSQLVEALDLGPHVDNGHARAWCFVMLCLNSVVAYYCGRVSMRWRRAFMLIRSAHRL